MNNRFKSGLFGLAITGLNLLILRLFGVTDPGMYVAGTAIAWFTAGQHFIK
ncbi:MAG: hypothetical protein LBE21_07590 [Pseudomonadales bacterium]|jgi:hypothetical protein|nr:hypothetical protein [Pseudomonadales bacterium]